MKTLLRILGVLLLAAGLWALLAKEFSYTKSSKEVTVGPVNFEMNRHETVKLPPAVGVGLLAGGAVLLVLAARQRD
ncbi:MAG TPA: hypothetical protein PK413_20030 [Thermoanaerobaculia bacterium]|nr:hypothetical protein [Thermoanaerobaculia bacterium]